MLASYRKVNTALPSQYLCNDRPRLSRHLANDITSGTDSHQNQQFLGYLGHCCRNGIVFHEYPEEHSSGDYSPQDLLDPIEGQYTTVEKKVGNERIDGARSF